METGSNIGMLLVWALTEFLMPWKVKTFSRLEPSKDELIIVSGDLFQYYCMGCGMEGGWRNNLARVN